MTRRRQDLWNLYRQMLRCRRFEEAVRRLWDEGAIAGEMHLGLGEEAIAAGVVDHLGDGDALALDHRGTPPLVVRGMSLVALLRELLGDSDGLCGGWGGHMHLFSREHLAASSGIVGAAGPAAAGFAAAARQLGSRQVAVAFFGEGAMNQGMLLESLNLSRVWELPVLFVCKDNGWAITTRSRSVTAGSLLERARAFDLPAEQVDGTDVEAVWEAAGRAFQRARRGAGPSFLLARCDHLEGHFLGDPLRRVARRPVAEMKPIVPPLLSAATARGGAPLHRRVAGAVAVTAAVGRTLAEEHGPGKDPLQRARRKLRGDGARLEQLESEVDEEIHRAVAEATL